MQKNNIETFVVTGERGLIGAVAAIGFYDCPDYASSLLPEQIESFAAQRG